VSTCQHCGEPLEQAKTGRPRLYCSRRCKRAARRRRQRRREWESALAAAKEALREAELRLFRARAACEAPDANPVEGHEFAAYTGAEWLAARRSGLGSSPDYTEVAEAIRERFEPDQG
jgi:hypothetical protein